MGFEHTPTPTRDIRKIKRELKSNLNKILPVNCKVVRNSTPSSSDKTQTGLYLKSGFKYKKDR